MKIKRSIAPFLFLQRVFSGKLSTACGLPLSACQEGDRVFGRLKGLAPSFHSQFGAIAAYRDRCADMSLNIPDHWDGVQKILTDCQWEAALSEYPMATLSNRIMIRKGWELVIPPDTYYLSKTRVSAPPLMFSLFAKLSRIMNGETMYAEVLRGVEHTDGVIIGKVTHPVVRQITLLLNEVHTTYGSVVNESSDSVMMRFSEKRVDEFMSHKFVKHRMGDQLEILQAIFAHALRFQGFDQEKSRQMSSPGGAEYLTVNDNWDIVVPAA